MVKQFHFSSAVAAADRASAASALMRRLVVSTPFDQAIQGSAVNPFPGVLEAAWYDDAAAAVREAGAADLATLVAPRPDRRYLAEEKVIFGDPGRFAPAGGVKFIAFIKRRPEFSPERFQRYWAIDHGPIVRRTPRLRRYVQSHLLLEHYADGEPLFDGTAELWWDSVEDFRAAWASREIQDEQYTDAARFLGPGPFICVTREQVLREATDAGASASGR